jgi:BioD-like phosphotransacetylase family protein
VVAKPAKCLLVASIEAYSGKSTVILGIGDLLKTKQKTTSVYKPVVDRGEKLGFSGEKPLLYLDRDSVRDRLSEVDASDYLQMLPKRLANLDSDLILLECGATLAEGSIFNLSAQEIADTLEAPILLVVRYHPELLVDNLLFAQKYLGDRLIGAVINDTPVDELNGVYQTIQPFLEERGIPIFATLPSQSILRSVSVRELAQRLSAKVLCRADRLDLMVESMAIGAMNVSAALQYFRQRQNMAVVTGGDRTDIQIAALETSTNCLILTGQMPPDRRILSRAEEVEVPVLSVDFDTLTTVEIFEEVFGKVPIQEQVKIQCIQEMMTKAFDLDRLLRLLDLN